VYQLIWRDSALDALADIYVAADPANRAIISAEVEELNAQLRLNPTTVGESRSGSDRMTFIHRVAIGFRASTSLRTVWVTKVKPFGR